MGNQDLSMTWKLLNLINISMRIIYIKFPPLILTKILLMINVINLLHKEATSKITIHPLK